MNALPPFVRTFIAIDVPEDLKLAIGRIQQELAKLGGGRVSWAKPGGIHLTLKFLGDVDRDVLDGVVKAVRKAVNGRSDFALKTTERGGFPSLTLPRTLWLGVDGGAALTDLRASLQKSLFDAGFPIEGAKFRPHLTVGRVKSLAKGSPIPAKFVEAPLQVFEWHAAGVNVMASQLKPTGAEYSVVETVGLVPSYLEKSNVECAEGASFLRK